MKPHLPETPERFREELYRLFPLFKSEDVEPLDGNDVTFHAVLMDFTPFFGRHLGEFSERQLAALAAVINKAAESPNDLSNAFETCFFEGLRKSPAIKALKPLLGAEAKKVMKGL